VEYDIRYPTLGALILLDPRPSVQIFRTRIGLTCCPYLAIVRDMLFSTNTILKKRDTVEQSLVSTIVLDGTSELASIQRKDMGVFTWMFC
jgi:hypothetical protein